MMAQTNSTNNEDANATNALALETLEEEIAKLTVTSDYYY